MLDLERLRSYEFVYVLHEDGWGPECKVGCGTIRRAKQHATTIGRSRIRIALWQVDDCKKCEKRIHGLLAYYGLKMHGETERFNLLLPRTARQLFRHLSHIDELDIIGGMLNYVYRDPNAVIDAALDFACSGTLRRRPPDLCTDRQYIVEGLMTETALYSVKDGTARMLDMLDFYGPISNTLMTWDDVALSRQDVRRLKASLDCGYFE